MKTLIIDTSSEYCLLAVAEGDCIVSHSSFLHKNQLSRSLLPDIAVLLQQAGLSLKEIERIAVGVGPGSYTGTRVGAVVARCLSYGLQIPLRGFCSLLAFLPPAYGCFASVLAAKSGLFFLLKGEKLKKSLTLHRASLATAVELQEALQTVDYVSARSREELCPEWPVKAFFPFQPDPANLVHTLQASPTFAFEAESQLIYLHAPV